MRIEEVIGVNIRAAREKLGMKQVELGKALVPHLGDQWERRQAVSNAETGKRAFTAAELMTIAHVLAVDVMDLFHFPAGVSEVTAGELKLRVTDLQRSEWLSAWSAGGRLMIEADRAEQDLAAAVRDMAAQMAADPVMADYILGLLRGGRSLLADEDEQPLAPDDSTWASVDFGELVEAAYRKIKTEGNDDE